MRCCLAVLALFAAAGVADAVPATSVCPAATPRSAMTPTLTSDFKAAAALGPRWSPMTANPVGNPAIEAEVYFPSQVSVSPRTGMRITAAPGSNNPARPYRSGGVSTQGRFSQLYGRFEAAMRLPQQNGLWPGWWTLPADGTWPPEIDGMEYIYAVNGVEPPATADAPWTGVTGSNLATTLHYLDASGTHQQTAPAVNDPLGIDAPRAYRDWNAKAGPGLPVGFHKYGFDWRPGLLEWFVDDVPVFCTTSAGIPTKPQYLILNLALANGTKAAPGWAGFVPDDARWPQAMDVLYVHAFQFKDLGTSAAVSPGGPVAAAAPVAKPSVPPEARKQAKPAATASLVFGKIGKAEATVVPTLSADDPGLCSSGTPANFAETAAGWTWACLGSGGNDPSGLAFRSR